MPSLGGRMSSVPLGEWGTNTKDRPDGLRSPEAFASVRLAGRGDLGVQGSPFSRFGDVKYQLIVERIDFTADRHVAVDGIPRRLFVCTRFYVGPGYNSYWARRNGARGGHSGVVW